jgi:hypothetical protein
MIRPGSCWNHWTDARNASTIQFHAATAAFTDHRNPTLRAAPTWLTMFLNVSECLYA